MEKNQTLERLNKNLNALNDVDNEIAMVELAIYQKSLDDLKNKKINEVKDAFKQKAKFYNQKVEKYDTEINDCIKKIQLEMDRLINSYDNLYANTFKIMTNAMNNQKNAIANIVTLTEMLHKENSNDEKIRNTIIACAEEKLNYAVIIDECKARIKWCTNEALDALNEIFQNDTNKLQIYDENIFNKTKRNLFNIFAGKSSYKKFVEDYGTEYLKNIKPKINSKVLDVTTTLSGIIKQMEETKKQISVKYKERMCA